MVRHIVIPAHFRPKQNIYLPDRIPIANEFSIRTSDNFIRIRYILEEVHEPQFGIHTLDDVARWSTNENPSPKPDEKPWVDLVCEGISERYHWWMSEQQTTIMIRLTITLILIHPTNTTEELCKQAGGSIVDEIIKLFSAMSKTSF
jgi:hypothetical protein